jgi:hypothetical protein
MYTKIQVVFDAAEPAKLAEFWLLALDYVIEPPPRGLAPAVAGGAARVPAVLLCPWRTRRDACQVPPGPLNPR